MPRRSVSLAGYQWRELLDSDYVIFGGGVTGCTRMSVAE